MIETANELSALWPLVVYVAGVVVIVAGMIALSFPLGERHRERSTDYPFESGVYVTGPARIRFRANFFLLAILFVVFDLESVFLLVWAPVVRETGWPAYIAVALFVIMLVVAWAYLLRQGALDIRRRTPATKGDQAP